MLIDIVRTQVNEAMDKNKFQKLDKNEIQLWCRRHWV